jgi:hypothetical protein
LEEYVNEKISEQFSMNQFVTSVHGDVLNSRLTEKELIEKKKELLGLAKKKNEKEIQIQAQPISLMKDILRDRYDSETTETVENLPGKNFKAIYTATIINKKNLEIKIVGEAISKNKKDAKRDAALDFLKKIPAKKNQNLTTDMERNKTYIHILDKYMKFLNEDQRDELSHRKMDPKLGEKLYLRTWKKLLLNPSDDIIPWIPGINFIFITQGLLFHRRMVLRHVGDLG